MTDLKSMPVVTFEQIVRFRNAALERIKELEKNNPVVGVIYVDDFGTTCTHFTVDLPEGTKLCVYTGDSK